MLERSLDRTVPFEAEIAVARRDRNPRDHRRPDSGPVDVELLATAQAIGDATVEHDDLHAEDVLIEGLRSFEIADRDDDVVQPHGRTIRARGRADTAAPSGLERVVRCRREEGSP